MSNSEKVYRQFVQFEERAASVYLQLASHFSGDPKLSSFWLDMAMHEKQHAGLVQFCLCERLFANDLPSPEKISELDKAFEHLERRATDRNLSVEQAFVLAIEMETSEVNSIYSNLTTTVHNSTYLLRRKITTSVPGHIAELVETARQFGVRENALEQLVRAKERWKV